MKTATAILLPLFVAGLLLSGCSGLDDDPDPGKENPSDFEGTYQFFAPTDFGPCTIPTGSLGITMNVSIDGTVTSIKQLDLNTGETITLSGHVGATGDVKGKFNFSFPEHTDGTFQGIMSTIECDKDEDGFITGKSGGGAGTWRDFQSDVSKDDRFDDGYECGGTWLACIVNQRTRN